MSLTGRFSALFLSALALVLVGFSTVLYVSARIYLDRQVGDRLAAALAILAAAAEIHADGVEWEPQERILPLGQDSGPERLRWMVFDDRGQCVDHSRNWADSDLTAAWIPDPKTAELSARLVDRRGRNWRASQRRIRPDAVPASGSKAAAHLNERAVSDASEVLHPSLVLIAYAAARPDGGNARRAGLVPGRSERGDLAAGGPAVSPAVATRIDAADADGRVRAGP